MTAGAAPTDVYLVRHALPTVDGTLDPGLAEVGRAQAAAVTDALVRLRPTAVVTSPLRRARETVEPLAHRLGLPLGVDERWREWDSFAPQEYYRPPEQLAGADLLRRQAYLAGRFEEFLPPHDAAGLQERTVRACRELGPAHPGGVVVVGSHGGAINALVAAVVGAGRTFLFDPEYTGITGIRVAADGLLVLRSVNVATHLPPSAPIAVAGA